MRVHDATLLGLLAFAMLSASTGSRSARDASAAPAQEGRSGLFVTGDADHLTVWKLDDGKAVEATRYAKYVEVVPATYEDHPIQVKVGDRNEGGRLIPEYQTRMERRLVAPASTRRYIVSDLFKPAPPNLSLPLEMFDRSARQPSPPAPPAATRTAPPAPPPARPPGSAACGSCGSGK